MLAATEIVFEENKNLKQKTIGHTGYSEEENNINRDVCAEKGIQGMNEEMTELATRK